MLKYEALHEDVPIITASSTATCLCLSDKILALGTDKGNVHLLDYSGHEARYEQELHDDKAKPASKCDIMPHISAGAMSGPP
jgi:hypothetical protein